MQTYKSIPTNRIGSAWGSGSDVEWSRFYFAGNGILGNNEGVQKVK